MKARALGAGTAEGWVVYLSEPLSFWEGVDCATGMVIDRSHLECGVVLAGRILIMPSGRGTTSSPQHLTHPHP